MLVPYYSNKKDKLKTYENNDYRRIDLQVFLNALTSETIKEFEDLNGFDSKEFQSKSFLEKCKKYPPVNIGGDNFVNFKDFFISAKMLFMTGFTCKYGFWKKGGFNKTSDGKFFTHHGIDLILPEGTPITSFSDGTVVRAAIAPGYGNCVIVKSTINLETLYFCYEHLQSLEVQSGDEVNMGNRIGTCGNTGNSFGYHLHFQIDKQDAKIHPYWSSGNDDVNETLKNCIDPWEFLRNKNIKDNNNGSKENNKVSKEALKENIAKDKINNSKEDDIDLISSIVEKLSKTENNYGDYINFFVNAGILKGDSGSFHLDQDLTRYQMSLILYRLYKSGLLQINEFHSCVVKFDDISNDVRKDGEFMDALNFVFCSNIMNGDNGHFLPWNKIKGEQFLAIIGRIFAQLKDANDPWYKNYLDWAVSNNLVDQNWIFINRFVPRRHVFAILYKLLID